MYMSVLCIAFVNILIVRTVKVIYSNPYHPAAPTFIVDSILNSITVLLFFLVLAIITVLCSVLPFGKWKKLLKIAYSLYALFCVSLIVIYALVGGFSLSFVRPDWLLLTVFSRASHIINVVVLLFVTIVRFRKSQNSVLKQAQKE